MFSVVLLFPAYNYKKLNLIAVENDESGDYESWTLDKVHYDKEKKRLDHGQVCSSLVYPGKFHNPVLLYTGT